VQGIVTGFEVIFAIMQGRRILRGVQISYPKRSRVLRLYADNQLSEENKEEELVDVAPGWG